MKQSLSASEWSLLAVFAILMGTFVLISKVNAARAVNAIREISEDQAQILVTVEGAVKKAGQFSVPEGTPIYAVLQKARPCPWADLKALRLNDLVLGPISINIPELKEVRVFVEGEVLEPGELVLPVGSRIADLKSKIRLTSQADKGFLRRKRLLRDGEKIEVPKKKLEQNK